MREPLNSISISSYRRTYVCFISTLRYLHVSQQLLKNKQDYLEYNFVKVLPSVYFKYSSFFVGGDNNIKKCPLEFLITSFQFQLIHYVLIDHFFL